MLFLNWFILFKDEFHSFKYRETIILSVLYMIKGALVLKIAKHKYRLSLLYNPWFDGPF